MGIVLCCCGIVVFVLFNNSFQCVGVFLPIWYLIHFVFTQIYAFGPDSSIGSESAYMTLLGTSGISRF